MRTKRDTVCHTCRRHKIGCDGKLPICTQCHLTGRQCGGYVQEMIIFQHKPSTSDRNLKKRSSVRKDERNSKLSNHAIPTEHVLDVGGSSNSLLTQPTWEESVALLTQQYIPKDEIPFLSYLDCRSARICGGWVQALPHVSQGSTDFERILLPAVRAMTLSMMVTNTNSRKEYLDAYGDALHGIKARLAEESGSLEDTAALASMCLTLSEVLIPTSNEGWKSHLRGVAGMMCSRGPHAFVDGVPHLLFVGFRPLIVLDSIAQRKDTFLREESWRQVPFSSQPPSCMQDLLGYGAVIPRLLERLDRKAPHDLDVKDSLLEFNQTLQDWEGKFVHGENAPYFPVAPSKFDLSIDVLSLPDPCFEFRDVTSANSLTHCWAFRIVCLLELFGLETQPPAVAKDVNSGCVKSSQRTSILHLCTLVCQSLPYLLQKDMALFGPLSAAFPLRMVLESIVKLQPEDSCFAHWYEAIEQQLVLLGIPSMKEGS